MNREDLGPAGKALGHGLGGASGGRWAQPQLCANNFPPCAGSALSPPPHFPPHSSAGSVDWLVETHFHINSSKTWVIKLLQTSVVKPEEKNV